MSNGAQRQDQGQPSHSAGHDSWRGLRPGRVEAYLWSVHQCTAEEPRHSGRQAHARICFLHSPYVLRLQQETVDSPPAGLQLWLGFPPCLDLGKAVSAASMYVTNLTYAENLVDGAYQPLEPQARCTLSADESSAKAVHLNKSLSIPAGRGYPCKIVHRLSPLCTNVTSSDCFCLRTG